MKNVLTGAVLALSGALIFFSVESQPGKMFADNPTTHVVDTLTYLGDVINETSVHNFNK